MDPRLQELIDHRDIRKTLALYCHACDRGDEALMASLYTGEDSFDDHGHVKASGPEYARIMTALVLERTTAASHIMGQSIIKLDGDEAAAETPFVAYFRLPQSDEEPERMNQLIGRFVDRLKRVDGQWKIHHRICVRDSSTTTIVERDDYAAFGFVEATRDASDAGSALLSLNEGATR